MYANTNRISQKLADSFIGTGASTDRTKDTAEKTESALTHPLEIQNAENDIGRNSYDIGVAGAQSMHSDIQPPVELRQEAAKLDVAGRYEPGVSESGIPADVLAKLLPGDDVLSIDSPYVAGNSFYCCIKRLFDVFASVMALVLFAIPMAVIAIKIKNESKGPVIYAQRRVGKDGAIFSIYKFRTMFVDAEKLGPRWATGNDPRVTRFGRFLRRTRLDEIPQFWNVLRGEMSLVGPRPERPSFCDEFEKRIRDWHFRTLVKPGLTGLAQISGGYDLLPKEKIILDMEYVENRSLRLDIKIIMKTVKIVFTGQGSR